MQFTQTANIQCSSCGGNIRFMGDMSDNEPHVYNHICMTCGKKVPLGFVQKPTLSGKVYPSKAFCEEIQAKLHDYLFEIQETVWCQNPKDIGEKCLTVTNIPWELVEDLKKTYPVGQMGSDLRNDW